MGKSDDIDQVYYGVAFVSESLESLLIPYAEMEEAYYNSFFYIVDKDGWD